MSFIEIENKKYEIVGGFSYSQYDSKKEWIHKYAERKNFFVLVGQGQDILIGKEAIEAEFKDIIKNKEEKEKQSEENETTNSITSIEKYIPK